MRRVTLLGLFLLLGVVLLSGAAFADDGHGDGQTVRVDCARGRTLAQALERHARPLTVEFTGTCTGDVTIPGDDITLRGGDPSATIIGTVTLIGRSRVRLEDFTVRDTPVGPPTTRIGDGIVVLSGQDIVLTRVHVVNAGNISMDLEGSWVDLIDCTVTRSRNIGVAVALGSVVHVFSTLTVSQGSSNGIMVTDKGQIQFSPGARIESSDNQGSGLFIQLQGHAFVHGGVRLTTNRNASGINVVDHGNLTYGGVTIEVSGNRLFGVQVGQLADWTLVGGVTPNVRIVNNGGPGLLVSRNAFVRLRENTTITGNAGPGLVVDEANVAIRGTTIQGNGAPADVILSFGAQATFDGGNTVGTPLSCDGTVRVRGQFSCPAPLATSLTGADKAAAPEGALPEVGPELLRQ